MTTPPRDREELVDVLSVMALLLEDHPIHPKYAILGRDAALSILDALESAGCVVVPKEATEKMVGEGIRGHWDHGTRGCWHAMLASSPYRREERDG